MPDYRLGRLKGRFVVTWHHDGRRSRHRLLATDAASARAELREFARERDSIRLAKKELTVGDVWHAYITEKVAQGKVSAPRMVDAWKALSPRFATLRPNGITAQVVREYVAGRAASQSTIQTELGYLRAALRQGVRDGLIASAPHFTLPPKSRPRGRYLTTEEARKLIDAAAMPHVRLFIRIALHTAGRPSSILDLTWERVEFDRGRISFDNPRRDRTAKGRATVPLAGELVGELREAQQAAQTNHVIEWAGKPVKSIKKGIRAASARAKLKGITAYTLRHTAAVWMAEGGVPMEEIAQFMGHTSPAVTFRTYARYSPDYLRRASDAISTRLSGSLNLEPGPNKNE